MQGTSSASLENYPVPASYFWNRIDNTDLFSSDVTTRDALCKIENKADSHQFQSGKKSKSRRGEWVCPHPHCGRIYTRKHSLKVHMNSHLGISHFSCPLCTSSYSMKSNCLKHLRTKHSMSEEEYKRNKSVIDANEQKRATRAVPHYTT